MEAKNILNKEFDKIYVITSPSTYKERADNICFLKEEKINFQLIVSTHKDNIKNVENARQADLSLNNAYNSIFIDAVINGYNKICTLEDDIFLEKGYQDKLQEYFKIVDSSWDIINLGYHYHGVYNIDGELIDASKYDKDIIFHKIKEPEEIIGTHCMAFKRSVFKNILLKLKDNLEPIDYFFYKNIYYNFNCFQLRKKIFLARSYRAPECDNNLPYKIYKNAIN